MFHINIDRTIPTVIPFFLSFLPFTRFFFRNMKLTYKREQNTDFKAK